MPEISAILPTRNRAHLLAYVLDGLRHQSLSRKRFEIIAVNDGSTDNTQATLESSASDLPIRILYQRHAGIAEAKNLGIFASRSDILLFIDDDDVPYPDLLEAHLAAHAKQPEREVAILGQTILALDVARRRVMRHVTQVGGQLFSYRHLQPRTPLGFEAFWGGRSSCKRSLLLDRGIFNPIFKFGCEDIELGWRLRSTGFRVVYEPSACSAMIRALTFKEFCARQERQGRSQRIFSQLHPCAEVNQYCEIDCGLEIWQRYESRFVQFLDYVERLDRLAEIRERAGLSPGQQFQDALDDAYRTAFLLCRAKGVAGDETESDAGAQTPSRAVKNQCRTAA